MDQQLFEYAAPPSANSGWPAAVKERPPNYEQHVREMFGFAREWELVSWEVKGKGATEYLEIVGGVYRTIYTKGKNAGRINFSKPEPDTLATVALPTKAHDVWISNWEKDTGHCHRCFGTGQACTGWSAAEGSRFSPCKRCDATGRVTP